MGRTSSDSVIYSDIACIISLRIIIIIITMPSMVGIVARTPAVDEKVRFFSHALE